MTPTTRNRITLAVAILVAGGGLAFISFGKMGENLVYYWSPSEMVTQGDRAFGPTIRLGGIVKEKSIEWNPGHTSVKFRVADNKEPNAPSVEVLSTVTPPQMFREGIGVVVEGTYDKSQVFKTSRLMVNHSNEYKPPKPGDQHQDWKQTMQEPTTAAAGTSPTP
jgi:cytochrome c-type biogenesis protein CcmE